MTFAHPFVAVSAVLVAALVLGAHLLDERRRDVLVGRLGEQPLVRRMMAAASPGRRRIKALVLAAAAALVTLAAAGPGRHGKVETRKRGLDSIVALDVSKSMMAVDLDQGCTAREPHFFDCASRLSHARAAILSLLGQLEDDRIGVIVFAGGAVHFPLTEDRDVAAKLFSDIGPPDLPPGSDPAEALRLGRCLLRSDVYDDLGCGRVGGRGHGGDPLDVAQPTPGRKDEERDPRDEERGKAIIIFGDGGGDAERTAQEVVRARDLGIAIFWVGVGTERGGDVPELDSDGNPVPEVDGDGRPIAGRWRWKRDRSGQVVHSKLDRDTLTVLATAGGDVHRYLDLPAAVREPDGSRTVDAKPLLEALEQVKRGTRIVTDERRQDIYHWFLFPAFLLFVIEACIATRRRMLYPEGKP